MKIPERLALAGGLWLLMASATDAQIISIDEFDTDEPITIAADNLVVDSNSRDVTFTGSVEVRQGELTVFADTMIIHYADETGTGENRVREIRAISNVSVVTPNGTASGDSGLWTVATGIVTLQENVTLVNDDGILTGSTATLELESGRIHVAGGEGRVNVLLTAGSDSEQ